MNNNRLLAPPFDIHNTPKKRRRLGARHPGSHRHAGFLKRQKRRRKTGR